MFALSIDCENILRSNDQCSSLHRISVKMSLLPVMIFNEIFKSYHILSKFLFLSSTSSSLNEQNYFQNYHLTISCEYETYIFLKPTKRVPIATTNMEYCIFYITKSQDKNLNILRTKRAFKAI